MVEYSLRDKMRTHSIQKPVGTDAATDFVTRQQSRAQDELQIFSSTTVRVEHTTRGIRLHVQIPPTSPPGPSVSSSFTGVYVPGQIYQAFEEVVIQSGPAAGTYVSTIDNNINDPSTGIGWMQTAPGNTAGSWT